MLNFCKQLNSPSIAITQGNQSTSGGTFSQIPTVAVTLDGEKEDSFPEAKTLQMSTHNELRKNLEVYQTACV